MSAPDAPRLLYVVTHGMAARHLLRGQLAWMRERGFHVGVCASPGPDLDVVAEREGVDVLPVPIPREIAPGADLRALRDLRRVIRQWRPDVVNAGTPKAGLLGMLAARAAGVPVRLYTLRGLRLETARGARRALMALTERTASACAHEVIAVSRSLAEAYVGLGLAPARKVRVLGGGASNGVAPERFEPPPEADVAALRRRLDLPEGAPVIGFVGRFTRDKGIAELAGAFERVHAALPEARLVLVGDFEAGDPVDEAVAQVVRTHPAIVRAGFVADTAPSYALMDVLAFPSHREGFPNVPLEAAAAGVPTVGFLATGTRDAVDSGTTGVLVPIGDVEGLARELLAYLASPDRRHAHGAAARARAAAFGSERVWSALLDEYVRLLREAGRPLPVASTR